MDYSCIFTKILYFIKDKERIKYQDIIKFIIKKNDVNTSFVDVNDCIFDLITEGILKVGIVYSYESSSSEYFIDKEALNKRIKYTNIIAC